MEVVDCSKLSSKKKVPVGLLKFEEIIFLKKKAFLFGGFDFCSYICSVVIEATGYKPVRISLTTKIIPVKRRRSLL